MELTAREIAAFCLMTASGVFFYLLPYTVARVRRHPQTAPIAVVNLFLGWTGLGWVVALAWAVATTGFAQPARRDVYELD